MKRATTKAVTWKVTSVTIATLIMWGVTGNWKQAGLGFLIISPITFVLYIVHEKIWDRTDWGRKQ